MKSKKPAARRPTRASAGAGRPASTRAGAPAPAKRKGLAIALIGLVALALVAQSVWVFYGDRKAQVTLHFAANIAVRGPGKGTVQGARYIASDPQGNVYYLQGGGEACQLQKFDRDGKWQAWVYPEGPEAERLHNGFAVAAGADGHVWVVERGTGALKEFDKDLKLLKSRVLPEPDLTGVAIAPDGSVWAASFAGRLLVLKPGAEQATPFTGEKAGRLITPFRLCFDDKGGLYVLDFDLGIGKDPSIKSYDPAGKFLRAWRVKDLPMNEFACIAWHPAGYVVLNDPRAEVVDAKGFQFFTPEGKLKFLCGLSDTGQNLRSIPAFAISPAGDWYLDLTPMQQGCGRFSWTPAP